MEDRYDRRENYNDKAAAAAGSLTKQPKPACAWRQAARAGPMRHIPFPGGGRKRVRSGGGGSQIAGYQRLDFAPLENELWYFAENSLDTSRKRS